LAPSAVRVLALNGLEKKETTEKIKIGIIAHVLGRGLIYLLPILNPCPLPTETILQHAIYNVCN
jgi:hypothetical protein